MDWMKQKEKSKSLKLKLEMPNKSSGNLMPNLLCKKINLNNIK